MKAFVRAFRPLAMAVAAVALGAATSASAQTLSFDASSESDSAPQDTTQSAKGGGKNFQINKLFSCPSPSCNKTIYKSGSKETIVIKYFSCIMTTGGAIYFMGVQDRDSVEAAAVAPQSNGGNVWIGSQSINLVIGPNRKILVSALGNAPVNQANCTISGVRE